MPKTAFTCNCDINLQRNSLLVVTSHIKVKGGQPDSAADYRSDIDAYNIVVPSYSVINLLANYNATDNMTLRLSIDNIVDKEY